MIEMQKENALLRDRELRAEDSESSNDDQSLNSNQKEQSSAASKLRQQARAPASLQEEKKQPPPLKMGFMNQTSAGGQAKIPFNFGPAGKENGADVEMRTGSISPMRT